MLIVSKVVAKKSSKGKERYLATRKKEKIIVNSKLFLIKVPPPPGGNQDRSIFEPEYFGSYTMFKQRNSDYYLGCDASGTLTLVENWNLAYPNPQALFIANKPNKST